ncbi:dnaJ homolog subfamily C member 24 [Protopterus annectens]|uniref:dnaJ homolog subfamily C member 24 n=1 Tax=Protopterus annectens TaxID=7888 RepID=UPI001CF9722E|nr:dnaJ homolog subfamily C member 24 [Protopterus annectens]
MDGKKQQKDWYRILGAEPYESQAELKLKYQKLALLYHPDKQSADMPAGEVEELVQRFIEINQAWKILGNEKTKKEYDVQRREDELMKNGLIYTVVHLEDMDWNDDEQCYIYRCRCGGEYLISKEDAKNTVSVVSCDTCSLTLEVLQ